MDEYARAAAIYDPILGPFLTPIHRAMVQRAVDADCRSGIDLCCGTGRFTSMAAHAGLDMTGIDLSPAMIAVARRKHPELHFILDDATALDFPDNTFSLATISFALHEKPRPIAHAILAEAQRVIQPGGLIIIADYRHPEQRTSLLTGWGVRCVERLAGKEHAAHFHRYMTTGATHGFLTEAGLAPHLHSTHLNGWAGVFSARNHHPTVTQ